MTLTKTGYLCMTIHQLRLKNEFCDIINSIAVKKDFDSNARQYARIHEILQEVKTINPDWRLTACAKYSWK